MWLGKMNNWSKELITRTRLELEEMVTYTSDTGKLHWLIGSSDMEIGAHFKNIDGIRFGIMTTVDAYEGRYIIFLNDSREQEVFESVDALIEAGWVLD